MVLMKHVEVLEGINIHENKVQVTIKAEIKEETKYHLCIPSIKVSKFNTKKDGGNHV